MFRFIKNIALEQEVKVYVCIYVRIIIIRTRYLLHIKRGKVKMILNIGRRSKIIIMHSINNFLFLFLIIILYPSISFIKIDRKIYFETELSCIILLFTQVEMTRVNFVLYACNKFIAFEASIG